jgi:hypothetical protein
VKAPFQMLFINRLAKVADDPIVQGADPVNIIGVGSHEDCRNRAPCLDEVSVSSIPVIAGMFTSAIRQAVSARRGDARKSAADAKASAV